MNFTFFTEHVTEWIIGLTCAASPLLLIGIFKYFTKNKVLSKTIPVPFWVLCIIFTAILSSLAVYKYSNRIQTVSNKVYGNEKIIMNGKRFYHCDFNGSELVFTAGKPVFCQNCEFTGVKLNFDGSMDVALHEIAFLYSIPFFRAPVDTIINQIRNSGLANTNNNNKP